MCAAETDDEALYLRPSQLSAFARLRTGCPGKLPRPVGDLSAEVPAEVEQALSCSATGSLQTVRRDLGALVAKYRPDEIIVTGMIHDYAARLKFFEISAEALSDIAGTSRSA